MLRNRFTYQTIILPESFLEFHLQVLFAERDPPPESEDRQEHDPEGIEEERGGRREDPPGRGRPVFPPREEAGRRGDRDRDEHLDPEGGKEHLSAP